MTLKGTCSGAIFFRVSKEPGSSYSFYEPVGGNSRLTNDHEDEEDGGRSRTDVEHDSDVVRQLVQIVHVRHEDGREQEPNGDTHL